MFKLFIWIVWLIILLVICMMSSRKTLLTPQFVYIGCFLPQAVFALYFVDKWSIDLSTETMLITMGGTLLFLAASSFFSFCLSISFRHKSWMPISQIKSPNKEQYQLAVPQSKREGITVERWKLFALFVFEIASLLLVIYYFLTYVPGSSLSNKMLYYNNANKFGKIENIISLPVWVSWPRIISTNSCYITGYILINNLIKKSNQHTRLLLLACLVAGMMNMLIIGTRIDVVGLIIALVIQAYFIWGHSNNWTSRINIKSVVKVIMIGVLILVLFQWSLQFIGRENSRSFFDYLGVYIAAPLKNLDSFVREGHYGNEISNWETLRPLLYDLGESFNIPQIMHQKDLPFRSVRGIGLGNVYTLFYCYLHDGGAAFLVVFTIVEALVAQLIYKKAITSKSVSSINLSVVLYSYVLYTIFMGFFSDRFFCSVFTFTMLRTLLLWWLLYLFFSKCRIVIFKKASSK